MFSVPNVTVTITKTGGAGRQVEAEIRALQCGDFNIAVTLAGAAEVMLDRPGLHMFAYMLNSPRSAEFERKELIQFLNSAREWLKHPTPMPTSD
jgi:hypothetical protein